MIGLISRTRGNNVRGGSARLIQQTEFCGSRPSKELLFVVVIIVVVLLVAVLFKAALVVTLETLQRRPEIGNTRRRSLIRSLGG